MFFILSPKGMNGMANSKRTFIEGQKTQAHDKVHISSQITS